MAYFDLSKYETVDSRIKRFWDKFPNGRIHTEVLLINEKEVVFKASVFTDREDQRPASIDFAQETVSAKGVNSTSWVENCATSAIGRALATLGFSPNVQAGEPSQRPSREEMAKAERGVARDYLKEAQGLADAKDLEGLRVTYKDAERNKVDAAILEQIMALAGSIK